MKRRGLPLRRALICMLMMLLFVLPCGEALAAGTVQDTSAGEGTKDMSEATLLNTYGSVYGYSGTCINREQLEDAETLAFVKKHYNSITLENEMKPDFVLQKWSKKLISVEEAKALGYYIPESYTEAEVPELHFEDIDAVMKICAENGLMMRAHTLVWHSQTPTYFFREGYGEENAYVDAKTMDARMEFYVKTVMNHVYSGEYGHVVYAWDVCNEYLNAKTASASDWVQVYGVQGNTPDFVKRAFGYADEVLQSFGIRDSVSLFYNDYNTYFNSSAVIELIHYLNSEENRCDGIGMQAHLDASNPSASMFVKAVQKFVDEGFEVQLTEMDVTNPAESAQATYLYNIMSGVNEIRKNGGNITGITYWGLYDSISWRAKNNPLLFTALDTPKEAYTKVLEAYFDAGLVIDNEPIEIINPKDVEAESTEPETTMAEKETMTESTHGEAVQAGVAGNEVAPEKETAVEKDGMSESTSVEIALNNEAEDNVGGFFGWLANIFDRIARFFTSLLKGIF